MNFINSNKILLFISLIIFFNSCSCIDYQKNIFIDSKKPKQQFFTYLVDNLKGKDPRERFLCMFARFININLTKKYKPKYPTPCSPPFLANYIIYVQDSTSKLHFKFFNNDDSLVNEFSPKKLKKGYYFFQTEKYEFSKEEYKDIYKIDSKFRVEIELNKKKYNYNLILFR